MKKQTLIKLVLISLVTILSSGFTIIDKSLLNNKTNINSISEYTDEILVSYPPGSNITDIRNCIINSFNGQILQITPCPSNPNIETLKFFNLLFQKGDTNGVYDGTDTDRKGFLNSNAMYVSQQQILDTMANCNAFIFAYYGNQDCGSFGAFQSGF
ncbi:hypothetical protein [uncultured Lacinutrix sp.]|uniref:hypothetical protein n=1 Tax=uncultured Lacinutrix sp. TaxID=574032 RepID=UPI0026155643|nr:hypothetical protein [uncultured Lacinutrix sp.]